jgi:hypothetical protein
MPMRGITCARQVPPPHVWLTRTQQVSLPSFVALRSHGNQSLMRPNLSVWISSPGGAHRNFYLKESIDPLLDQHPLWQQLILSQRRHDLEHAACLNKIGRRWLVVHRDPRGRRLSGIQSAGQKLARMQSVLWQKQGQRVNSTLCTRYVEKSLGICACKGLHSSLDGSEGEWH